MKNYKVREALSGGAEAELLAYPPAVRHLLFHRGVTTSEEAEKFLNPDYDSHTHDPFLMKGMAAAADRILRAIGKNEKVVIFSDYDADGIPGAVVLHDFFKKIGFHNFENYIPHRGNEGFGLNHAAIEEFSKNGAKLLITIDCGIADAAETSAAQKLGIDVIVTDHHEPNGAFPDAFAVLDPKQKDCAYPDKNLCGSGVIFKLVQGLVARSLSTKLGATWRLTPGWEKWLLDMVGLATLSDMVPLTGENRVFAYYGLKVLRKSPRFGLQQLLRKLRISQRTLTEDDIGFMIAPRINAASRMGVPSDAFKLLSTDDVLEAGKFADHLDKINNERKGIVASLVKEVGKIMTEREADRRVIVIGNPNWKPSLLGLVANSLMREHRKPVFLWGREENSILKGSCRSDGSVNVVSLMAETKEMFVEYGGHELSGGFSVEQEKVHLLEDELEKSYERISQERQSSETADFFDAVLSLDEVNEAMWKMIDQLAPFGTGNPKPTFLFKKVAPVLVKQFGKEKNHLELVFENSVGEKISAIGFFQSASGWEKPIVSGQPLDLVATFEKSYFRPRPEIRLRIVDII